MTGGWFHAAVREPLVHFLVAGSALFVFNGYYGDFDASDRRITLDEAQVGRLADQWQQTWRRAPTARELDGLIREYIKDEVYSREAVRLGLDDDDPIIRRRLREKMEFLATAEVENTAPTEAELNRYYLNNKPRYVAGAAISFEQRYYGEDESTARNAIAALNSGGSPPVLPLSTPAAMDTAQAKEISREFGDGFAAGLSALPSKKWGGPVRSGFGWHAVRVRDIKAAAVPPLANIVQQVTNDWRAETKAKREAAAYQALLDGYAIRIAKP